MYAALVYITNPQSWIPNASILTYLFPTNIHKITPMVTEPSCIIFRISLEKLLGRHEYCQKNLPWAVNRWELLIMHAKERLLWLQNTSMIQVYLLVCFILLPNIHHNPISEDSHPAIQPKKALNIRQFPIVAHIDIIITVNHPGKLGTSCTENKIPKWNIMKLAGLPKIYNSWASIQ